jgi:hypothetical protein
MGYTFRVQALFPILISIHDRTQYQSRRVNVINLYTHDETLTLNLLSILCTPWEDWVQPRSVDALHNFRVPADRRLVPN